MLIELMAMMLMVTTCIIARLQSKASLLLRWCSGVLKVYFCAVLCQTFDAILLCNITLHDYTRVSAEYVESNQNVIVIFRCFVRKPSRRLFGLI